MKQDEPAEPVDGDFLGAAAVTTNAADGSDLVQKTLLFIVPPGCDHKPTSAN
jgi:hypothetical protein